MGQDANLLSPWMQDQVMLAIDYVGFTGRCFATTVRRRPVATLAPRQQPT